jgi:glyoxylase I family protein
MRTCLNTPVRFIPADDFWSPVESTYVDNVRRRQEARMRVNHVLAVVPVTDIGTAARWYEQLFGVPPTNRPMPTLAEWRATNTGWLQVFLDPERAGHGTVNFAVDDLAQAINDLKGRGLVPGEVQLANKGVRLSALTDPDNNAITLIGGFREIY